MFISFSSIQLMVAEERSQTEPVIYIIPPNGYQNEKLFDMSDQIYNRDDCMRPFYVLREALRASGYDLKTTTLSQGEALKNFAGIIVCGIPSDSQTLKKLARFDRKKVIAILLEPPAVIEHYYDRSRHTVFGKIYIMFDDWVDNEHYFKLYYPQTTLTMINHAVPFHQKKFCTMIAARKKSSHPLSLYKAREHIIHFFEHYHQEDFDLYGHGWNIQEFSSYKGPVISKIDTLKNYKFCICYENMRDTQGYITEKIFDVLIAGCVPIYYGAKNICSYVDPACFIWREDFESDKQLYAFLASITASQYKKYIEAAKIYLQSKKAYYFSTENFVKRLLTDFLYDPL
jgi:hypothetical protein